jgi:RNA polymerase sigma-70 factor (ECF subfamily)
LGPDRTAELETALEHCRRGDNSAFAAIVQAHQAMVFSIGWHYLQDRSLAEDMAQEVFLELYQRLNQIESAAHLTNWLRRVTVHRCIDQGRRRKVRPETPLEDQPEPTASTHNRDHFALGLLARGLAKLDEKQRMIVILRYQEELGPAEIAELTNMPVNTVKSTLHRSLAELRKKLTRSLGEVRYAIF